MWTIDKQTQPRATAELSYVGCEFAFLDGERHFLFGGMEAYARSAQHHAAQSFEARTGQHRLLFIDGSVPFRILYLLPTFISFENHNKNDLEDARGVFGPRSCLLGDVFQNTQHFFLCSKDGCQLG